LRGRGRMDWFKKWKENGLKINETLFVFDGPVGFVEEWEEKDKIVVKEKSKDLSGVIGSIMLMAGHSHWHNIKYKKGRSDLKKADVFKKLATGIRTAVKLGGPNPKENAMLQQQLTAARLANFPKEKIQSAIRSVLGNNTENGESITYEGKGENGTMLIIDATTDNRNKIAQELRYAFSQNSGVLHSTGSVNFYFNRIGTIQILNTENTKKEGDALEIALEIGAENMIYEEEAITFICQPSQIFNIRKSLEDKEYEIKNYDVIYAPKESLELSESSLKSFTNLLKDLREVVGVVEVYHNVSNLIEE